MPPTLYRDSPAELITAIKAVEHIADQSYKNLVLSLRPIEEAICAVMTSTIAELESAQARFGPDSSESRAAVLNLAQLCPMVVSGIKKRGLPENPTKEPFTWNESVAIDANRDIKTALNYHGFLDTYPMWHQNRVLAELLPSGIVKFSVNGNTRDRQVNAYQQGLKPLHGRFQRIHGERIDSAANARRFKRLLGNATPTDRYGFAYEHSFELARHLNKTYKNYLESVMRRSDRVDLGIYSLGTFKAFFAAFLAICAIHEHMCFRWQQLGHLYPLSSAVLIKQKSEWINLLSNLSLLDTITTTQIINDMTYRQGCLDDLHVYPFVPLEASETVLGVIPHYPLASHTEENIFRICSYLRKDAFNSLSNDKANTMRSVILKSITRFRIEHSIDLPDKSSEIDLLVEDLQSSTVIMAELKWYRKPAKWSERLQTDEQFLYGIKHQLENIRSYSRKHPAFLKDRNKLTRSLDEYDHVYYLLIARDHWIWVDPSDDIAVVDFDQFLLTIDEASNLYGAVAELLRYEWLPIENTDFHVRFDTAEVGGASIQSEVFYGGPHPPTW